MSGDTVNSNNPVTPKKTRPGSFAAFLQAVRLAGSGTEQAETALQKEKFRAGAAGMSREAIDSVWQRMRRFGLWLQGDGEPVALTPKGLLWLNEHTA